jgi:hypothetical protein
MSRHDPICSDHPHYRGQREPQYRCSTCWIVWLVVSVRRLQKQILELPLSHIGRHEEDPLP